MRTRECGFVDERNWGGWVTPAFAGFVSVCRFHHFRSQMAACVLRVESCGSDDWVAGHPRPPMHPRIQHIHFREEALAVAFGARAGAAAFRSVTLDSRSQLVFFILYELPTVYTSPHPSGIRYWSLALPHQQQSRSLNPVLVDRPAQLQPPPH